MDRIFISYRREDSAATCGRIYDRLAARFGKDNVFKDVESIPLGVNFEHYIGDVVSQCAVQLVVIGPTWVDVPTDDGQRRLDDPNDLVRVEIEAALNRNIPVIPVLVQGATLPRVSVLPHSLKELVSRNGIPVRYDPDFEPDVARLINALETWMAGRESSHAGSAAAMGAATGPGSPPPAGAGGPPSGQAQSPTLPQPGMPQGAGAPPPAQQGGMPPATTSSAPMPGAPLWAATPPGAMPQGGMPPGGIRPAGMPQGQPGGMPPGAMPQGQPQMGAMPPGGMSPRAMPSGAMPPGTVQNQPGMAPPPGMPPRPVVPPYHAAQSYQANAPTFPGGPSYQPASPQMQPMMPPTVPGGGGPTQPGGPLGGPSGGGRGNRNMGLIIGAVAAVLVVALVVSVLAIVLSQGGKTAGSTPTHTPSATATPTPTTVYQSKLNSQSAVNGWIGDNNCLWSTDGIHLKGATGTNYCLAPTEADITDGTISVEMKEVTAGTGSTFFGIAFRAVSSSDKFTGYTFDINDNGQWCFGKTLTAGGNLTPVSGCNDTASAAIHGGVGGVNTVVVSMKGSHFTFSVNGEVITQADDSDISAQTVVGVYVSQGEEVVFTNFVVTK